MDRNELFAKRLSDALVALRKESVDRNVYIILQKIHIVSRSP